MEREDDSTLLKQAVGYNLVIFSRVVQVLCLAGDISTVKTLSQLSWYHNTLTQPYLKLLRGSLFDCQCDCKSMIKFKIYDEVRKWKCNTCAFKLDSFTCGCWTKKRFREAKLPVCNRCYWSHWHLTGFRPIQHCLLRNQPS
jgi:hypothetical protein